MELTRIVRGEITVSAAMLFTALDDLSRSRPLSEAESIILERLLRQKEQSKRVTFSWTAQADMELLQASHQHGGIKAFAAEHSISQHAAYVRLNRLRKRLSGAASAAQVTR